MKAKSPIVALTLTNLDHVTGGCKLAGGAAAARSPKPSFGMQVEAGLGLTDAVAPLRDLSTIADHATALAGELLSSADLGMVSDIAIDAIGDATASLPPIWCGPTAGANWGDQGDTSAEMSDEDDDDDDDDDDKIEEPATTAPLFLDDEAVVETTPEKPDFSRPVFDRFDRGEPSTERGEPGSAWDFTDGPPPPSAPIRHTEAPEVAEDTGALASTPDANNFFVMGPPPAMAPIRGATAAAPTSLAFEAAPSIASSSSGNAQIRDHRR